METQILWEKRGEWMLEQLYLIAFGLFVGYCFLTTTMFRIEWSGMESANFRIIILVIIFARILCSDKIKNKEFSLLMFFVISLLILWRKNGSETILITLILLIGARGISFRKILQTYLSVISVLLIITIASALTGRIENLVFHQTGRRPRASFGIIYPTDFSAYLFYGSLVYCYIRKEFITYIEIGVVAALGIFVYVFCDARLNTVCLFLTAAIFGYNKIRCNFAKKAGKQYEMNTAFSYLLAVSTTLCAILSVVATIFYSSDNKLMLLADRIFNNRLRMGKKGIDLYGFSLTGQYIPMQGNGGTEKEPLHYFFLDNSYMYVALQLGLIFLCIVLFGFMLTGFRARREKNWVLLWAIAIMSVQCIVEHHILEVMYNPFLWAVFADTNIIPVRVRKKKQKEGERI